MDKALSDEEARCLDLASKLAEAEQANTEYSARAESHISEVESDLCSTHAEIEQLRKTARERVCRHASDMEILNDKLCKAHVRCSESDSMLEQLQSNIAKLQRELQDEIRNNEKNEIKIKGVNDLEKQLSEEVAICSKLREDGALYRLCESDALKKRCDQLHEHEALYSACESRLSKQNLELEEARHEFKSACESHRQDMGIAAHEMQDLRDREAAEEQRRHSEEAEVFLLRQECVGIEDLRQDAAEIGVVRALEQQMAEEAEHSRRKCELVEQMVEAVRAENAEGLQRLGRAEDALHRADLESHAESGVARAESLKAQEARQDAIKAQECYETAVRRSSMLENELQEVQKSEASHRSFWVSTHNQAIRAVERTMEEEQRLCQEKLATEESTMSRAIVAMEEGARELRAQLQSEVLRAEKFQIESTEKDERISASENQLALASNQLAGLEFALASEYSDCSSIRKQLEEKMVDTMNCFQAELHAASLSNSKVMDEEEMQIASLRTEVEECAELRRQVCTGREKNLKLQEAAEALRIEDEELTIELAQARTLARKHGQAATEYRADLVATKRDLAKAQHAQRDLKHALEEADTLSAKFSRAQRGREVAEHEVKQSQGRLVALDRQVRELQTRLAAERFARNGREPNLACDGPVDTLVFNGQHSHHLPHSGIEVSRGTSPHSAALAQPLRRNRSVERSESVMSDAASMIAPGTNLGPASPGMGRSHSLGEFIPNTSENDEKSYCCQGQVVQTGIATHDGSANISRIASAQPPRPPQIAAPRMGWATHARSREVNNERQGDLLYSPGTSSSSIDRVIR